MSPPRPKISSALASLHRTSPAARRAVALSFLSALIAAATPGARPAQALGPNDRRLTNARSGISVEAPAGWTLSQHTGYANTVVLLLHPDGSRISVSTTSTSRPTADQLYQQNRPGLIAQRLVPTIVGPGPRGSLAIDLAAPGRSERMRQLYLVRAVPSGYQAIVLTLASKTDVLATRLPALELVASRLTLDDPLPPESNRIRSGAGAADAGAATTTSAPVTGP